ncbi:hypothetical protein Unana1_00787 [Umbelopsis nana]
MNHQFVFEDGTGNRLTEDGQPMDIVADTDMMELEDLATMETYTKQHGSKNSKPVHSTTGTKTAYEDRMVETRTYSKYSEHTRKLVIDYYVEKLCSAAAAGRHYNVERKTAQRWIKAFKEQQNRRLALAEDIDETSDNDAAKQRGKQRILGQEHKDFLVNFIDDHPTAVLEQAMESLKEQFEGLTVSKSSLLRGMALVA